MESTTLTNPNFSKLPSSPELEPSSSGIEILIGNEPSIILQNNLWMHGVYQIPHKNALHINSFPLHKALVITATSGTINMTKNLSREAIFFDDDEQIYNNIHKGYFNYDLTDWLNMYEEREYYITVSLWKYISNTLKITTNPVPAP